MEEEQKEVQADEPLPAWKIAQMRSNTPEAIAKRTATRAATEERKRQERAAAQEKRRAAVQKMIETRAKNKALKQQHNLPPGAKLVNGVLTYAKETSPSSGADLSWHPGETKEDRKRRMDREAKAVKAAKAKQQPVDEKLVAKRERMNHARNMKLRSPEVRAKAVETFRKTMAAKKAAMQQPATEQVRDIINNVNDAEHFDVMTVPYHSSQRAYKMPEQPQQKTEAEPIIVRIGKLEVSFKILKD